MLEYAEELTICEYCKKKVKMLTADTPVVRRTYCPICLRDVEVIWKEKR